MGVSGCGKSSVGMDLAARLGLEFVDGDDLHPPGNVRKMRLGEPLEDADRWPWLDRCGATLIQAEAGLVLACSALRRCYRDRLRLTSRRPNLRFVCLATDPATLRSRMVQREGHFMPPSLLNSQLAALEPPEHDENALTLNAARPLTDIVSEIVTALDAGDWHKQRRESGAL